VVEKFTGKLADLWNLTYSGNGTLDNGDWARATQFPRRRGGSRLAWPRWTAVCDVAGGRHTGVGVDLSRRLAMPAGGWSIPEALVFALC